MSEDDHHYEELRQAALNFLAHPTSSKARLRVHEATGTNVFNYREHIGRPPSAPWLLPEHIVSGTELRRLLGNITRATLIAWRRDRGFPEPVKQLEREAVWDIREVRAWMRKR
jgi:predicted DNA-binding transcriptional regulator AlpA